MKQSVYLSPSEMDGIWSDLVKREVYFIDGVNSLYVPSQNTSYIDLDACEQWPDEDGVMKLMTPGMAARTELKRYLGDPNLRANKKAFRLLDISPPMFFTGRKYQGWLWYFDLQGAYYQIYRPLTLDCKWPRGQGDLDLAPVGERLASWKPARNSVIGISRQHNITAIKGKSIKLQPYRNPYFNPHLWHTVQMWLHQLANVAIIYGAIYISTDAFIFHKEKPAKKFKQYMEDHCMRYHEIIGNGYVYGWSSYRVGSKETKIVQRRTDMKNKIVNSEGVIEWWMKEKRLRSL